MGLRPAKREGDHSVRTAPAPKFLSKLLGALLGSLASSAITGAAGCFPVTSDTRPPRPLSLHFAARRSTLADASQAAHEARASLPAEAGAPPATGCGRARVA